MLIIEAALRHAIKGAIVSLAACLLSACAFQSDVCGKEPSGKLTYYIASVREKKIQGNWGDRAQWVQRQETADGRWALETVGLGEKQEGLADAKMLDSTGAVVWEGRVYDVTVLAPSAPAFAATSSEGGGLEIYNLAVGPRPAFAAPELPVGEIQLSRDGSVFVVPVEGTVWIISLSGKVLYQVSAPDSLRGVSIAAASGGRYVAFGGADPWLPPPRPAPSSAADTLRLLEKLRRLGTPVTPAEIQRDSSTGPDDRHEGAEFQRLTLPGPNPRVIVRDQTGETVGEIRLERGLPYTIALSEDDPPRVAIATGDRVSLWSSSGVRIWEDSLDFAEGPGLLTKALNITTDGRLFAITAHFSGPSVLWAWGPDGTLDTQLNLPPDFEANRRGTNLYVLSGTGIMAQSDGRVASIRWKPKEE
jgi:hypothetical protein